MKYTFSEYQKLRSEHDKEMECLDWVDGKDFVKMYNAVCEQFQKHPDSFSVVYSRPVMTHDNFKNDLDFWYWLQDKFPDKHNRPIVGWWPTFGWWSFFKTGKDLIRFNEKGPWKDDIVYNMKSADLYDKGVELIYKDDTKKFIEFDEIEYNK